MTDLSPTEMRALVEAMKARDERIALIGQQIDIEAELRDSPTWTYILHMSEMLRQDALTKFLTAPAHDQNRIRQLQNQAGMVDYIKGWISELSNASQAAEQDIAAEEGRLPAED
jgi:ABC-type Mn2+/Zn2+ transport system ATPase subunit